MTAPAAMPGSPRPGLGAPRARKARRSAFRADVVVDVLQDGPSMAGRIASLSARLMIRPALSVGSHLPSAPWPWGAVEIAARAITPPPGTVRTGVGLAHCTAQLVRAAGVLPADGIHRAVLYLHGGAFLTCGAHSHGRLVSMLSSFADSPVLVPNYRKIPKHSIGEAIDDCYDGYSWLRRQGYEPDQIVLAGDSAGGYLALTLAQRLLACGERPAAMVAMSPLLQLATQPKTAHPNIGSDAMFPPRAFEAFHALITRAAAHPAATGHSDALYEPLDHIRPGLPPMLIHVSGREVLLHDAQLAAQRLATAGVPVEVQVWPGQIHVFQLAAPMIPEATRSLRQIGHYIREATG
ncbi:alpha/beta hydrolase [Mycobacterium marseillense]|uniref:Alpha/beta hydrolase n=2 Tax=Mycobacterium marseillense TaxID=701042 RepID=A0AAC9VUL4_9MYCO|nr:alpha/beta hydrolase [Mycobacterium marseillense]ASW90964.1 alpha/beta hydrolase [Mycobacterium marseillense]MCA2266553.1 alpha/beta hydrolase [Mycobacterium marseillense]MCV7407984.1 alpha/beta hydrolase [Mycobacterium marseillense]MDM3976633.1 alpha/beta hydrolase [Mycobacterium marseillense]OBJ72553.1 esterase [Mycobacterium marseillense]